MAIYAVGLVLEPEGRSSPSLAIRNTVMERGFATLRTEMSFETGLVQILNLAKPSKEIGANRVFSERLLRLLSTGNRNDTNGLAEMLERCIAEHLPNHGRNGGPVDPTGVQTIVGASKLFNIHYKTLDLILKTYEQPEFFQRHRLVSKPVLADLERRLKQVLNQDEIFEKFGLTALPGKAAAKEEIISPMYPVAKHRRTYSVLDVENVILSMSADAEVTDTCPEGQMTIPKCAASIRCKIVDVLIAIKAGRAKVLSRTSELRFDGMRVEPAAVRTALLGAEESSGLTRRQTERRLRTQGLVVQQLIDAKVLLTMEREFPARGGTRVTVLESSVQSFEDRYLMIGEIVRRSHIGFKHVRPELAKHGVFPVEFPNMTIAIYERSAATSALGLEDEPSS